MHAKLVSFGQLELDGHIVEHDVVVEGGAARKRKKGPSKPFRDRYGHTPLSVDEEIPWSASVLVIGTGTNGQLPVMDEVFEEAERRGVRLITLPTREACHFWNESADGDIAAILHVTC
jgi:hypothetical protein